jgi:hypothetical protein
MSESLSINYNTICEKILLYTCEVHKKPVTVLKVADDSIEFDTCCETFRETILSVIEETH